jgi:hypothetical protein
MRRFFGYLLLAAALPLCAQTESRTARSAMQQAYGDWRQADPNLEADSAISPATMGIRADHVAAAAAKYFNARKAYYDALDTELQREARSFSAPAAAGDLSEPSPDVFLRLQQNSVDKSLSMVPNDADPGFQELRKALERERAALSALVPLIPLVKSAPNPPPAPGSAGTDKMSQTYLELAGEFRNESLESQKMGNAWADYYRALSQGARDSSAKPVMAATASPVIQQPRAPEMAIRPPSKEPASQPAVSKISVPSAQSEIARAGAARAPIAAEPTGEVRSSAPEFAPVSRYVGSWIYPTVGEHYHGAHPETVDLSVREENGKMMGTFRAHFRLPAGSKLDPQVEFTFAGPFQASRKQALLLVGAIGTLELIPAAAFNLMEVNFQTPDQAGKITRGDFFLVRK